MQEKGNVSANTVSTIDPEEPIRNLNKNNPRYTCILHTLRLLGAFLIRGLFYIMNSDLEGSNTPEERELLIKQKELSDLKEKLVQYETDLASLHADLHVFDQKYYQIIGIRYQELDCIESQIRELERNIETNKKSLPSKHLKALYRQIARLVHPDLAADELEKEYRRKVMIEVNKAYEDGDKEKLNNILEEWNKRPESVEGEDVSSNLIRIIRKIAQVQERLRKIQVEMSLVEKSDVFQLRIQVLLSEKEGRNLLQEMADRLDQNIHQAQIHLKVLRDELSA
jgi:hypothetical protein